MMALFGKPDPKPPTGTATKPGEGSSTPPASAGNQDGAATAAPSTPPTPPPSSSPQSKASKPIPGLAIRAIPEGGFCRAGRRWSAETQLVALSEFTEAQVLALREETNLDVADVEITPVSESASGSEA
jgi:hypothetical protein